MKQAGFANADVDVGLMHDEKVRRLARSIGDPVQTAATLTLYVSVVLASWESGRRATFDDALPWWWTESSEVTDDRRRALLSVGMLDEDGRLPEHAWENHAGTAMARKARLNAQAAEGGRTTQKRRREANGHEPTLERALEPTLKSVRPSDRPKSVKDGRKTTPVPVETVDDGRTFAERMAAAGFASKEGRS